MHALSKIMATQKDITVEVCFVGVGASRSLLEDMAIALGLKNNVSFLGAKRKEWLCHNLKNYDLLLQPSRIEGFGLTIVEGMAAKIPVLISNIEGPMEVIMSDGHGYFFETENSNDCATKIMEVISGYQRGVIGNRVDKAYI